MERLTKREGKHTIRIGNEWRRHDPVWEKLAHYEDLEEQGRLIELPCKVGTVLYFFGKTTDGTDVIDSTEMFSIDQCLDIGLHIGHGFYLTKEEAEAKLKEMVGVNNDR